jgi:putative DNA primase/helicase
MPDTLTPDVIAQTPDVTSADVFDKDALLAELASLAPMDYEQRRTDAAKLMGVRVGTLDDAVEAVRAKAEAGAADNDCPLDPLPAPWDEAVDGAKLLDDLAAWYRRYLVLPTGAAAALALWTVHTYARDAAQITPRLAVVSPQKRCGKTTLLVLLGMVVYRSMPASNISAAALFRAIEGWSPTLVIDEADTFLKDNEELRGVLNAGHFRPNAYVIRAVPTDENTWRPERFRVWGPVAIALIGRLPSTLADRSITIKLRRKAPGEKAERSWQRGAVTPALPEVGTGQYAAAHGL